LPSRCGPGPTRIKKCVDAPLGSSLRAIETTPRTWLTSFGLIFDGPLHPAESSALHFH
jgi:hypothetical protein